MKHIDHIKKIIINNARRFGENVEIDFGAGATIILAPNGIGKTTIFEAIELALTGQIMRLENSPDAIIRKGFSEMNVRLDFSGDTGDKYCQAVYVKGGGPILTGNHKELFRVENNSSLPYLFRLTHFLEQRNKVWLVEQEDVKKAGNFLSQLPLGKDLQNIISKKTSLLSAITKSETDAKNALTDAQKKLSDFKTLWEKRDVLITETTLIPLEDIASKLTSIGKLIGYEDYMGEYNLTITNTYFEKIKVLIQQTENNKKNLVIKLNTLKERIPLYISNVETLNSKQVIISEHLKKIAELTPIVEKTRKDIQDMNVNLANIRSEIKKLSSVKTMFESVEQKASLVEAKKTELEQNEKTLEELKKSRKTIVEFLEKNERLRDQHKILNDAIENQRKLLILIEQKKDFHKQWQEISGINQDIADKVIPEFKKEKDECLKSKSRIDDEVSAAEKVYLIKKNDLEALNKASGAIQDAVSNIRKYLADDERCCPVCQAKYEPDELVRRIEKSLNTLNPAIPLVIQEEKDALDAFEFAKDAQKIENQKLLDIQIKLDTEHNKLEINKIKISEKILPQFLGCKTPEEANNQITQQIAQITSLITESENNRSQLEPEVDIEKLHNASLKKGENERAIDELVTINGKLQNIITTEMLNIDNINMSLNGKEKEAILVNFSTKSDEEIQQIDSIQNLEAILSANEAELKKSQDSLFNENEATSKIKASQEGICTEWSQAGLDGQPNEEALRIKQEAVLKAIDELEKANTNLNTIEQELASWRTTEKFHEIDNEIKVQIGDFNEESYLKSLKASVDQKNSTLLKIQEKKKAVNLFLDNVVLGVEQIHEQLNTINSPWKGLLKRIVLNPLIANTLLSNGTSRNKPIAKTSVRIHEQDIEIANIASEAQLTDLQLTLMLVMANKYQWTSWKALLLDDPTQHHDLVHASSVFDVLRDYIIDLDFQVMMSTHDSTQAKFFQRKLENEGVPSKIYQLVVRKDGVAAERLI